MPQINLLHQCLGVLRMLLRLHRCLHGQAPPKPHSLEGVIDKLEGHWFPSGSLEVIDLQALNDCINPKTNPKNCRTNTEEALNPQIPRKKPKSGAQKNIPSKPAHRFSSRYRSQYAVSTRPCSEELARGTVGERI
jgi:hypothetical protein